MSPRARGYRPGRDRREIFQAVLGVLTVLVVTAALIWVFAPEDASEPSTPPFTLPTDMTTVPTAPGGAATSVPTAPATTTPG